jgi:hypothetical protein
MSNIVFESAWTAAPGDDSHIDIHHNLGRIPVAITLNGRVPDGQGGYNEGLPTVEDGNGHPINGLKVQMHRDLNTVRVYKPAAYDVADLEFKITITE